MSAEQDQIDVLHREAIAAHRALTTYVAMVCPGERHFPVQHRDGRPPWCPHCRRTNAGQPIK